MADETDAGMEAPATGLAPESVGRIGVVYGSRLSCPTFYFGGVGPLGFRVKGTLVDHASPGWSVWSAVKNTLTHRFYWRLCLGAQQY